MPLFQYTAVDDDGRVHSGELEADGRDLAIANLFGQGLTPMALKRRWLSLGGGRGKRRKLDVAAFTRRLHTLLAADVGLESALRIAAETAASPAEKRCAQALAASLRDGASFAEALESQGPPFDGLYVRMVAAGEASGQLDSTLDRLAGYLEERAELQDAVRSALIYPAILLCVTLLSLFVLVGFVVPQFAELFASAGAELPLASQIVFTSAEFLGDWGWAVLLGLLAVAMLLPKLAALPGVRGTLDRLALRLPLIGGLVIRTQFAAFSHTLATLVGAGITLVPALGLVREVLGNSVLRREIGAAQTALREGNSLSQALEATAHAPVLLVNLVRVGEESGRLPATLNQLGGIYDREVRQTIQRGLALLEPALLIFLGLLIGGIIMSILLAILSVNELAF